MKKLSYGEMFNLAELHKLIRNADILFWIVETEGDLAAHYIISDGHITIRIAVKKSDDTFIALKKRFNGHEPHDHVLRSTQQNKGFKVDFLESADQVVHFAHLDATYEASDTRLTYDRIDGSQIRIFVTDGWDGVYYVTIQKKYFDLLNEYEDVYAEQSNRISPLVFCGVYESESMTVLPVVTDHYPPFLADL